MASFRFASRDALVLIALAFVFTSVSAFASNSGVTYQGRILKPDGTPLSGTTAQFKLQIRTPDTAACLMYEELQGQDMSRSNGAFALTIADGTGSRTDTTGLTLDKIFANHGAFALDASTCSTGTGAYAPGLSDGRNLVVLFKDETMSTWEPIPAQKINFVPFAFEAKQISGFTADSIFKVVDGSGNPQTGISPLSNAQYAALMALANGSSTAYTAAGTLGGSALPTMTSGQVLGWNGSAWISTSPVPAAGSITSTQLAAGAVTTSNVAGNVSINTTGTLGSAITTTRDFKIYAASPGTGFLEMKAPAIPDGTSYTLTWPLNVGAAGQVLTSDGTGTLSWAAAGTSSQWTTHAANISYDGAGNVGIGTTAPATNLDVVGSVNASASYALGAATILRRPAVTGLAVGAGSFTSTSVGSYNYSLGDQNMLQPTFTGSYNNAFGFQALEALDTTSSKNIGIGYYAGRLLSSGSSNVIIGHNAGSSLNTGSKNLLIGQSTDVPAATTSNFLNVGNALFGTGISGTVAAPAGNIGIGTTAPSARLQLPAGTATAATAPLKFTAGTLMTTPEDGAMESTSGGLYYTIGTTRYVIPTNTAAGNYSNVSTISNSSGSITMSPMAGNSVIISSGTSSLDTTSGALVVTGGTGISGAVNAGGNIASGGTVSAVNSMITPQIYGGTVVSANIKIDGTSNATAGNVLLATGTGGGFVGIGTTAPAYELDVNGAIRGTQLIDISSNSSAVYSPTSSSLNLPVAVQVKISNNSATDGIIGMDYFSASNSSSIAQRAYIGAVSNAGAAAYSPTLVFGQQTGATAYNERMRIGANGNVGIGTTAPTYLLDVNGGMINSTTNGNNAYTLGRFENTNAGSAATAQISVVSSAVSGSLRVGNGASTNAFEMTTAASRVGMANTSASGVATIATNSVERLRVDASGNVGIGTTAPSNALQVTSVKPVVLAEDTGGGSSGGGTFIARQNTGSVTVANEKLGAYSFNGTSNTPATQRGASIEAFAVGGWGSPGYVDSFMSFTIGRGGSLAEVMRLDHTGNVGIGTTSPTSPLTVNGVIESKTGGVKFPDGTTQTTAATGAASQWTTASPNIYFTGGNVGIGTTSPGAQLGVVTSATEVARFSSTGSDGFISINGSGSTQGNQGIGVNSGDLYLNTAGAQRLRINSSGNLSLNGLTTISASDSYGFSVGRTGATNPAFQVNTNAAVGTGVMVSANPAGSGTSLQAISSGTNETLTVSAKGTGYILLAPSGGNVGIGTAAPASPLTVAGVIQSTSGGIKFPDGTTQTTAASGGATLIVAPSTGSLIAGTTGASSVTTASQYNSVFGYQALNSLTTGSQNAAFGDNALASVTTGYNNAGFGHYAGSGITTGTANTGIGWNAVYSGNDNTGVGAWALPGTSASSGQNTAVGRSSGYNIGTAGGNTSMGFYSLFQNQTGYYNTAIGMNALRGATGGSNTGLGAAAGYSISTGANNVAIGINVGSTTLTTGSNNILIGTSSSVDTPAASTNNFLNIGNAIFATGLTGTLAAPAGLVGIGTTAPSYPLDVVRSDLTASTEFQVARFATSVSGKGIYAAYLTNPGGTDAVEARLRSVGSVPLALGTTTFPQAMYILNSSGSVGIGTTAPTAKLEVVGEIKATDGAGNNRLWGQGRPSVVRYGTTGISAGLCTNGAITYGLSNIAVSWDGAQASCPQGTWVCSAAERGTGVCDTARPDSTQDGSNASGGAQDWAANAHIGWVTDALATNAELLGQEVTEQGSATSDWTRSNRPVWCCN